MTLPSWLQWQVRPLKDRSGAGTRKVAKESSRRRSENPWAKERTPEANLNLPTEKGLGWIRYWAHTPWGRKDERRRMQEGRKKRRGGKGKKEDMAVGGRVLETLAASPFFLAV
jgi:hypothetical protein